MTTFKLGFMASGGGTNLQAILDACSDRTIDAEPALVIGNNSNAFALERARRAGVTTLHLSSKTHPDPDVLDAAMLQELQRNGVDLIVLAGYNKRLGPQVVDAYRGRVINIHPGLLPKYGGQGMYGSRVHEAVIANGEAESGATVHVVDEEYDNGPPLAEVRVPVLPGDTPEALAARILEEEHSLYVDTLRRIAAGELLLDVDGPHSH